MRISSYAATVIAAALFAISPQAARADFLSVNGNTSSTGSLVIDYDSNTGIYSAATKTGQTYDGLHFSFQASVSGNTLLLSGYAYGTASPASLNIVYDQSGLSGSLLYSTLGLSTSPGFTAGSVSSNATANSVSTQTQTVTNGTAGQGAALTSPTITTGATTVAELSLTLSDGYMSTATANTNFRATAVLSAVPEPTGVLMGLLGLPCLGAVVFLARRRSAAMASMVA